MVGVCTDICVKYMWMDGCKHVLMESHGMYLRRCMRVYGYMGVWIGFMDVYMENGQYLHKCCMLCMCMYVAMYDRVYGELWLCVCGTYKYACALIQECEYNHARVLSYIRTYIHVCEILTYGQVPSYSCCDTAHTLCVCMYT